MGGYLDRLDASGTAMNVLALVGHVPIRSAVMGYEKRYPTADELGAMKDLLRQSLEEGAFGFSTGLIFPPSSYLRNRRVGGTREGAGRVRGNLLQPYPW